MTLNFQISAEKLRERAERFGMNVSSLSIKVGATSQFKMQIGFF